MVNLYTISGYAHFADAYGAGTYNGGTYNCDSTKTTCGTATSNSGGLVNTGVAVGAVVTLACVVLLVAVIVSFWRRPANKPAQQEELQESETEEADDQTKPQA